MKELTESEIENMDIEGLEEAHFTFGKDAFKAKEFHCDICKEKMDLVNTEMDIPNSPIKVKLNVFKCNKCKKEYLNFEEADKLGKALQVSKFMENSSYKIRRSLSFDGDNYIFRVPIEIARNLGKKPYVEMVPLSSKDFIIHLEKGQ